jgi:hypothetical protein
MDNWNRAGNIETVIGEYQGLLKYWIEGNETRTYQNVY